MIEDLKKSFEPDRFLIDAASLQTYGRDWTRFKDPRAAGVFLPRSQDEVCRFVLLCLKHRQAIVPSGGRTGLSGGALAANSEWVLSLERMRELGPVDRIGLTLRVEAGAITEAVHKHVAREGLMWPIDFAAKGSSQIGGNIATNAGGVRVLRYGMTREWVMGIEMVTGEGKALSLNGALVKNNTGYDLRQLVIGSEGTLGVITAATLKLTRLPGPSQVLLFGCSSFESVLRLLAHARGGSFELSAFETMSASCLGALHDHRGLAPPFKAPCYALLEVETDELNQAWLEAAMELDGVVDAVISQSSAQAAELWALREGISESLAARGLVHKNDIALPIPALPSFIKSLESLLATREPGVELFVFGHVGDGNLHLNFVKPAQISREVFFARMAAFDPLVFALVREHKGSISAEHGVGLLKKPYLSMMKSPVELDIYRSVKKSFDPFGIMNPGKILDLV